MPGRHNVLNALAAASLALGAGRRLDDDRRRPRARASRSPGRLVTHRLPSGAVLIDDSYNANPGSLDAAIDTLAASGDEALAGARRHARTRRGRRSAARRSRPPREGRGHRAPVRARPAERARGARPSATAATHFDTHAALAEALRRAGCAQGVRVLVKGSRGSAMDGS